MRKRTLWSTSWNYKYIWIKKLVRDARKLYALQENKIVSVLCSLSSEFYFIGDKIAADHFWKKITPSLKKNDGIQFAEDVVLNHVIEKVNSQ